MLQDLSFQFFKFGFHGTSPAVHRILLNGGARCRDVSVEISAFSANTHFGLQMAKYDHDCSRKAGYGLRFWSLALTLYREDMYFRNWELTVLKRRLIGPDNPSM